MGMTEDAQFVEQMQRDHAIEKARRAAVDLDGPNTCTRCGGPNDRRKQGFAVCTDCIEAAR